MAYVMRSLPNYPGDIQHDVRDFLLDNRAVTLGKLTGRCVDAYLAATRMLAIKDDPVADCLESINTFDMATLQIAHDTLAAFWRCHTIPIVKSSPAPVTKYNFELVSPQDYLNKFRGWLNQEALWWEKQKPEIVRLFCLVLVQQNVAQGILAEIDLFDELRRIYPVASPA